jgi:multidrug efflux pump subunit AcrA (membrane-fusion protein)
MAPLIWPLYLAALWLVGMCFPFYFLLRRPVMWWVRLVKNISIEGKGKVRPPKSGLKQSVEVWEE